MQSSHGLAQLIIDDNNVTIAGHPADYLKGYDVAKTLEGHGIKSINVDGEDIDALYGALRAAFTQDGPVAVVCKRKMCPGVKGVEGSCHGHDVIALAKAIDYLEERKLTEAVAWLSGPAKKAAKDPHPEYLGTKGSPLNANRAIFGEAVCFPPPHPADRAASADRGRGRRRRFARCWRSCRTRSARAGSWSSTRIWRAPRASRCRPACPVSHPSTSVRDGVVRRRRRPGCAAPAEGTGVPGCAEMRGPPDAGGARAQVIHQKYPDIFVQSGIMERGNFSAAAGFGMAKDRQVHTHTLRSPRSCGQLRSPCAEAPTAVGQTAATGARRRPEKGCAARPADADRGRAGAGPLRGVRTFDGGGGGGGGGRGSSRRLRRSRRW